MANPEEPTEPLLREADFTSYLEMKAKEMAPRDVEVLLAEIENEGGGALAEPHTRLGRQLILSLELLEDHVRGDCPQIPFYTISLLTEAVYYFLDPNDVIPDWIPGIGKLDDALVMELAFEYGADGIHRYCLWKGIELASLYDPSPDRAAAKTSKKLTDKTSQRRRAARTSAKSRPARKKAAGAKTSGVSAAKKARAKPAGKKVATKAAAKPARKPARKPAGKPAGKPATTLSKKSGKAAGKTGVKRKRR